MIIFEKKIAGLSELSLSRFALRARRAVSLRGTVNILVTSNAQMRALNRKFRSKDKATDVLSFPASPTERGRSALFAGEIAISADIALANAQRLGHSAALEIKTLALHGILHLAGFDHERDNGEMARKEARLRQMLRLPSTLIERSDARPAGRQKPGSSHSGRPSKNA